MELEIAVLIIEKSSNASVGLVLLTSRTCDKHKIEMKILQHQTQSS